jgi:hypothetical protein
VPRRSAKDDLASSVEKVVDRLYSLDPDEFTDARNQAAKELRAEGERASSDLVKGLRKPTTVAWAVNQLPRRHPEMVEELLAAGAELRSAQRAALSGSGKGALREATQRRRMAVARLLEEAAAVFRDAGRNPAPHVDAVRSSLEAASTDEATGDLVRAGRLTKEVEPASGFGDISPFEVLAGGRASPASDDVAGDEELPARRLRERLEAREAKAEDALKAAREAATEARSEADDAAKDVDRLERELQTARRRADRAAKAASAAESRSEKSEQALAKTRADLEAGS